MSNQYIGWIPCLSGELDFALYSPSLGRVHRTISLNAIIPEELERYRRRIVSYSECVNWRDYAIKNTVGTFTVFLSLESNDCGGADGKVRIVAHEKEGVARDFEAVVNHLVSAENLGVEISSKSEANTQDYKKLSDQINDYTHAFSSIDVGVEFQVSIQPDGLCRISTDQTDVDLQYPARQLYYYLKFALHRHQHHGKTDDSVCTLHSVDCPLGAGKALIRDLKFSLVQIKRNFGVGGVSDIHKSEGIVAYAKALALVCYQAQLLTKQEFDVEATRLDNLLASIDAMSKERLLKIQHGIAVTSAARSMVLLFFALVGPMIVLFKDKIPLNESSMILGLLREVFDTDAGPIAIAVLSLSIYFVYVFVMKGYGSLLAPFSIMRVAIDRVVRDRYKARVLALLLIVVATISILFIFREIILW